LKDFIPCPECTKKDTPGYISTGNTSVECECLQRYNSYVKLVKYLKSAGIPDKYTEYSISDYIGEKSIKSVKQVEEVADCIEKFVKSGFQLYLSGPANTQKTSIACYIARRAAMEGLSIQYTTLPLLVQLFRSVDFSKDFNEITDLKAKLDTIKKSDLLVIDDAFDIRKLYLTKNTAYYITVLEDFFKGRSNGNRSQIYISNKKRDSIDSKFGESIRIFLNRDCLELDFQDILPNSVINSKILTMLRGTK
jgi:DNA replication protein DnaC